MPLRKTGCFLLGILMVFVVGCGPKAIPPEAALDTPQHHAANGD